MRSTELFLGRYNFLLHALVFASIFDISGVIIGGFTLRIAWLFAPLMLLFIRPKNISIAELAFIILFSFLNIVSIIYNSSYSGLAHCAWVVFNFLVFYRTAGSKIFQTSVNISRFFVVSGRLQIVLGALLMVLLERDRLSFTYYEPSYMAVGLIPYLAFVLLSRRIRFLDVFLIALFVFLGQSALFVLLLLLTIIAKLLQINGIYKTFSVVLFISFVMAVFVFDSYSNQSRANHLLVKSIIENGFDVFALIDRGGNRFPRMQATFEVFSSNFLIGVGPGNYVNYTNNLDFTHITRGIPWLDVHGLPPVNIFLEAGVNAGIFGTLLLLLVFSRFLYTCFCCHDRRYLVVVLLVFVAGLIETNYLRGYIWLFFGIVAGQVSMLNKQSKLAVLELGKDRDVVF